MAFVAFATFVIYSPVLQHNFSNYDDIDYVTSNSYVQKGISAESIVWAFTTKHTGNWHPLTWLSHMLDVELFGLNPGGHHATSLMLHIANSLLLLTILFQLTGKLVRSLVVALLFALHPLHVESVAWVAERKDVLSTFFWLLTMLMYVHYNRSPGIWRYLLVFSMFCLGLMSKQMLVTIPFVLLLMDYWPLKREDIKATDKASKFQSTGTSNILILEKLPFFAVSAITAMIAMYTQNSSGALDTLDRQSIVVNVGNALLSYVEYIRMMFWPFNLAVLYPFDPNVVTLTRVAGAVMILTMITTICFRYRERQPYLLFGWLWYLVTLLPVIGFVRIGVQAFADRYTYIPLIGLFICFVWGVTELSIRWRYGRWSAAAIAVIGVTTLSILTRTQLGYWNSNLDLFRHTVAVTNNNWVAHNNLGMDLMRIHAVDESINHFQEAIRINPEYSEAYNNLGKAFLTKGNTTAGIAALREAVRTNPDFADARTVLGYTYLTVGDDKMAFAEYIQLKRINESLAESLFSAIENYKSRSATRAQK